MSKKDGKLLIEVLLRTIDKVGIKNTIEALDDVEIHITENQVLQEKLNILEESLNENEER